METQQTSKYQQAFKRLAASGANLFKLRGANMLVEVLPKEEIKTKGGIFLADTSSTQKATSADFRRPLGLVLMTGEGFDGENGEKVPGEVTVGMVVLMPYAPLYLSEFPGLSDYTQNTLAIINENDVLFCYESLEAFAKAKVLLNEAQ